MHRILAGAMALAAVIAVAAAVETAQKAADGSESLAQLDWLLGDWMDEGPEAVVTSNYRWAPDRRAILGEFHMHVAGRAAMTGTLRIAWDPLLKKVHSWVFDSQGGFSQGIWTRNGDTWVVTTWCTTADGRHGSATMTATRESDGRFVWRLADRITGDDVSPQVEAIHLVRTPPRPNSQ